MLYTSLTLVLFVQIKCEWVEISQQHYQKPLRTHHPLLASIEKASETVRPYDQATVEPADKHVPVTRRPVTKVSDEEHMTNRNRIYINYTLPDNNWDTGLKLKTPANVNNIKLDSIVAKVDGNHGTVDRKPSIRGEIVMHETKNKGDSLIVRRPNPDEAEAGKPPGHRTSIAGNVIRVRPLNNKESLNKRKPLDEYKGPIEILNLSDLEDTTAEDTVSIKLDTTLESTINHKQNVTSTTPKIINRRKSESISDQQKSISHEFVTTQATILKDATNMRRVEILRSTELISIKNFDGDDDDYGISRPTNSPKSESINIMKGTDSTPHKFPNLGHVKRVHIANTTRATRKPKPDNNRHAVESLNDELNFTEKSDEIKNNIKVETHTSLHKSTSKTFPVRTKPGKQTFENWNKSQVPTVPSPEDVMLEELITGDEKQFDIKVHKIASIGAVKRVSNPTKALNKVKNEHNIHGPITEPTPIIETDEDMTVEDEDSNNNFNNAYRKHDFTSNTEKIPILTTLKYKSRQNSVTARPEMNPQIERNEPNPYKPEFTKEDSFRNNAGFETTTRNNIDNIRSKIKTVSNTEDTKRQETQGDNNARDENTDEQDESEDPLSEDKKNNAMENLIKFLKTVTDIITKNTRRGVHSKLRYLEDLRDTILANIEERLEAEFPDDSPGAPGSRRARSAEPRGHVEFPSSEGALMTISFLTFAVFLIKLVLQVIQVYKNKTMMMMPTVVAAVGRAYTERRSHN